MDFFPTDSENEYKLLSHLGPEPTPGQLSPMDLANSLRGRENSNQKRSTRPADCRGTWKHIRFARYSIGPESISPENRLECCRTFRHLKEGGEINLQHS